MKYLRLLYGAPDDRDPSYTRALSVRNAPRYHPIARQVIASMLGAAPG